MHSYLMLVAFALVAKTGILIRNNDNNKNSSDMEELKKWIENELPNNGEWWNDGYLEFIDSAEKMLKAGMSIDVIKEILQDTYNAVSGEYGC